MAEKGKFGPYINARARALKSTLMSRTEIDPLLENGSVKAMIDALVSSPYELEMAEALSRYEGADAIEDAVSRNLSNSFTKLRSLCRGHYTQLANIFVGRWDLLSVKALIRNRHQGLDADTGASTLTPGPSMPVALLRELASQASMDALVRGLAAWNPRLCNALVVKLAEYQETSQLPVLEESLDRSYFVRNVGRLGSMRDESSTFVRAVLRMEIDRINLRTVLEPTAPGENPEDAALSARLLPRGLLPEQTLRGMLSAHSPEAALGFLERTPYASLTEGIAEFAQTQQFSRFERVFELALMNRLRRAALHQGIGIAPLLYYGWLKYNEVINLRMIARGLSVELPAQRIREEVVYV